MRKFDSFPSSSYIDREDRAKSQAVHPGRQKGTSMIRIIIAVCFLALPLLSRAQSVFPVRDEGEARNRTYHVVHYKIEVSFDEKKK